MHLIVCIMQHNTTFRVSQEEYQKQKIIVRKIYENTMQSVSIVRLDNVSFIRDNRILQDIDLCIDHGQNCAIIGQNGSGKTRVISIIYVYHQLSKGKACVVGKKFGSTELPEPGFEIIEISKMCSSYGEAL
jgi:ABC-type molybdenum transport system ATPase subunit/photorepair protein PhrA